MLYIATNINKNYYTSKHDDWIKSVLKYKRFDMKCLIFQMGFDSPVIDGVTKCSIKHDDILYSNHLNLSNRDEFICLESGEFVNFMNFNDDDVVILCDWDVTMQRPFTTGELDMINSMDKFSFGMNSDNYMPGHSLIGYIGIDDAFDDMQKEWKVFNTGIMVAKVSAWKRLFSLWKPLWNDACTSVTRHAAGQALFNYIVQKHDMVIEFPINFHNAHWFFGTPSKIIENKLYVDDDLVLFNHHKWNYRPIF